MAFLRTGPSTSRPVVGTDHGQQGVVLGCAADLARRKRTTVSVDGLLLLVIFRRKRFTVVENRCPHAGAALDDARVMGRTLTCAAHSYRYPLTGGACVSGPRYSRMRGGCLRTVPTREVDGCLYAIVDQAERCG